MSFRQILPDEKFEEGSLSRAGLSDDVHVGETISGMDAEGPVLLPPSCSAEICETVRHAAKHARYPSGVMAGKPAAIGKYYEAKAISGFGTSRCYVFHHRGFVLFLPGL